MTLKNFLQSLRRRWYVVVGGLLVTVGLCMWVYSIVPPTFERTASVLLLPGTSSIPKDGNPYLYLGGLGQASDVLVSALNAPAVLDPILEGKPGTALSVARDVSTSGPLLTVTASSADEAQLEGAIGDMLDTVPLTLGTLQTRAEVPAEARITSLTLTQDPGSTMSQKDRLEATGAAGAGGIAMTLLLAGFVDGLVLSYRRRHETAEPADAEPGDAEPSDDDPSNADPSDDADTDTDTNTEADTEAVTVSEAGYDDEELALARLSRLEAAGK